MVGKARWQSGRPFSGPRSWPVIGLMLTVGAGASRDARAQGLVPNPSFEQYTSCPTLWGEITLATGWGTPSAGSPDYFHVCAPSPVGVPVNLLGEQVPRSGDAYTGIYVYQTFAEIREYLQTALSRPLMPGETYRVSFFVSLADQSRYAVDRLGAYLSAGPVPPVMSTGLLGFVPQVESPRGIPLADRQGWVEVSATAVAVGGEDHLVIGGFRPDADLTRADLGAGRNYSYVWIDDIQVTPCSTAPPVVGLLGVKRAGNGRYQWLASPGAVAYHLNAVTAKRDLLEPGPHRAPVPGAVARAACDAMAPLVACDDAAAGSIPVTYYQVVTACSDSGLDEGSI